MQESAPITSLDHLIRAEKEQRLRLQQVAARDIHIGCYIHLDNFGPGHYKVAGRHGSALVLKRVLGNHVLSSIEIRRRLETYNVIYEKPTTPPA